MGGSLIYIYIYFYKKNSIVPYVVGGSVINFMFIYNIYITLEQSQGRVARVTLYYLYFTTDFTSNFTALNQVVNNLEPPVWARLQGKCGVRYPPNLILSNII